MQKKMEDEQLAEQKPLYGKYPYRGLMKREASISVYGVPSGPSNPVSSWWLSRVPGSKAGWYCFAD